MTPADIVRKATQVLDKWSLNHGDWRKAKTLQVKIKASETETATVRFSQTHPTSGRRYPVSIGGKWTLDSCEIEAVMEVEA